MSADPHPDPDDLRGGPSHEHNAYCVEKRQVNRSNSFLSYPSSQAYRQTYVPKCIRVIIHIRHHNNVGDELHWDPVSYCTDGRRPLSVFVRPSSTLYRSEVPPAGMTRRPTDNELKCSVPNR